MKDMQTGFEVLREVMVAGYKPSVARLYDPEDGQLHFSHFAARDDCILLFMAEGAAGITKATADAIEEIVARYPGCEQVDSSHIATWFADLVWGPEKVAEDEDADPQRQPHHRDRRRLEFGQRHLPGGTARIRAEIPGITLLGGHSSHSYINGTNMYFNYFYDLGDCAPEDEATTYTIPIISIIVEETLRHGGSIVHHHGIGKGRSRWAKDEYGSSYRMLEGVQAGVRPERCDECRHDHPSLIVTGRP